MNGIAPKLQSHWDWRAAGNFICGGTGTGLYVMVAPAAYLGIATLPFELLALALVATGLGLVWLELGRRLRALNVFRHPGTSWMTRESLAAIPFFAVGLAGAWLAWPLLVLIAALAGLIFLYCQARMIGASKGIPAWRPGTLVPVIVITGLTEGCGLFLAAALLAFPDRIWNPSPLAVMLLILVAARTLAWRFYRRRLAQDAPQRTLEAVNRIAMGMGLVGNLTPVVALAAAFAVPVAAPVALPVAGLAAMVGGWYLKFALVTGAAHDQGFALLHTPERGTGGGGPGSRPGWSDRPGSG